ncbi:MAG: VOC family protein [Thermoplasmata archaeon]
MSASPRFLYTGVRVRNLPRSVAFYRGLGFKIKAKGTMAHGGKWVHMLYPSSRHRLELNYYPPKNRYYEPWGPGSEFDHFGFYAPDLAQWEKVARRAGARKTLEFVDSQSRIVYYRDPDGVWLEAFGPAKPRQRRTRR